MIVILHGKLFFNYVLPWIRIAVPLFFVISSYFLFGKLNKTTDEKERNNIVKKFIFRNLKLYLIWFIIFLPVTIINNQYFVNCSFITGIIKLIRDFLFNNTFPSSWFIMGLIEGVLIIFYSSKKLSNKTLFIISLLANIFITLSYSYEFLFPNVGFVNFYKSTNLFPNNSFVVGLLWIMIGKLFAENKDKVKAYNRRNNIIFIIIVGILFYFEWYFIRSVTNDPLMPNFFMLIPFVILLFNFIINIKPFYFKESVFLRKMSTIIYVSHKAFIIMLTKFIGFYNRYLVVLIAITLSIILTFIINWVSKHIKFMENAY